MSREPALVVGVVVAGLVGWTRLIFGIELDATALTAVLLPIATALIIRPHVTPHRKAHK